MIETKTWNLKAEVSKIILKLPKDLERINFFVSGSGMWDSSQKPPVIWVRSRRYCESDVETVWGQSIYFQVAASHYGFQASKSCAPGALWLSPGETYEFEVTAEGFELDLVEITCILPDEAPKVVPVEAVPKKESWLDNPLLWAFLMGACFATFFFAMIYRSVSR